MTTLELLRKHGEFVALRVAAELGCGAADKARVLAAADDAHEKFIRALDEETRVTLGMEIGP